jgi:hypothetical protein
MSRRQIIFFFDKKILSIIMAEYSTKREGGSKYGSDGSDQRETEHSEIQARSCS